MSSRSGMAWTLLTYTSRLTLNSRQKAMTFFVPSTFTSRMRADISPEMSTTPAAWMT